MGGRVLSYVFLVIRSPSMGLLPLDILLNVLGSSEVPRCGRRWTRWAIPSDWCVAVTSLDEHTHVAAFQVVDCFSFLVSYGMLLLVWVPIRERVFPKCDECCEIYC